MSSQIALITFGCSWTYGVGAGYKEGMLESEFKNIAWDDEICGELSFRGILSKKYDLHNINFSQGSSSNQRQFRRAMEFFLSPRFKKIQNDYAKIIVLWGITSTARSEYLSLIEENIKNFKFDKDTTSFEKMIIKYSYDHNYEVYRLGINMRFWNEYFMNNKILNIWFDTFNHHNYTAPVIFKESIKYNLKEKETYIALNPDRLFNSNVSNRDLMAQLAIKNGLSEFDSAYHLSSWQLDSDKVIFLKNKKLLDPISLHPTKLGHLQIAEMFYQTFDKIV